MVEMLFWFWVRPDEGSSRNARGCGAAAAKSVARAVEFRQAEGAMNQFRQNQVPTILQSYMTTFHVGLVTVYTGSCYWSILIAWAEWQL